MTTKVMLKFAYEDNGYCRVYYKGPHRSVYCWQWEGREGWKFYRCTNDGEPSYIVVRVEGQKATDAPDCPGMTQTGRDLNEFLGKVHK